MSKVLTAAVNGHAARWREKPAVVEKQESCKWDTLGQLHTDIQNDRSSCSGIKKESLREYKPLPYFATTIQLANRWVKIVGLSVLEHYEHQKLLLFGSNFASNISPTNPVCFLYPNRLPTPCVDIFLAWFSPLGWELLTMGVEELCWTHIGTWMETERFLSGYILLCSSPTLRHIGSAKDVFNSQKGKPRLDSRKRLPESVWGSNQYRGSKKL